MLVRDNLTAIVLAGSVGLLLAALALVWLVLRAGRLQARLDGLTRGAEGASLEAVLDRHLETVFRVARDVDRLETRAAALEEQARLAFQRVGLVRFNPFEDTGGNQSFALALLDAHLDGFVISSLHARSGTRVYAKALSGGRSESALSAEEAEALRLAMGGRTGTRPAT